MFDESSVTIFMHALYSLPAVICLVYWLKPNWFGVFAIAWCCQMLSRAAA